MRLRAALVICAALLLAPGGVEHGRASPATAVAAATERAPLGGGGSTASHAVRPVEGPVIRVFAPPTTRYGAGHRGVDLAAAPGTPVRTALAGIVSFAGLVAGRGWVSVDHGGGLDTTYGWLAPRRVVAGERVRTGQILGDTAADAGHLDWGARLHGVYIDPLGLLGPWRARLVPVGEAGAGAGG